MASSERPMTPHILIYRWEITMILSTLHRMTGICLCGGTILLVFWLTCAALGPEAFEIAQSIVGHWLGQLALWYFTWCLFYHMFNGIRHMAWDAGYGFEIQTLRITGWLVYLAAAGATVFSVLLGYWWLGWLI